MAQNIETEIVPSKKQRGYAKDEGKANTNYAPNSSINEHSYGQDGGKANAQKGSVPSVVVGGASEAVAPPAMPGTLRIGEDKNVSTPVSG